MNRKTYCHSSKMLCVFTFCYSNISIGKVGGIQLLGRIFTFHFPNVSTIELFRLGCDDDDPTFTTFWKQKHGGLAKSCGPSKYRETSTILT